jgi:branched-chain amino acid transport system permease protein
MTTVELPEAGTLVVERPAHFRPSVVGWALRALIMAAAAAIVLVVPLTQGAVDVNVYTEAVIFSIIGLSLNVLIGYTGQISLGHQAFVGLGAFTSAYMVSVHKQPFFIAVGVAMAIGGLQALILGAVSLRITGLYFALVTLAYGTMAEESLFNIAALTGGASGQAAPKPSLFTSDYRYYYLCLGFLALVIWVDWCLTRSKAGRALAALRENPKVAATFGASVKTYTLLAFVTAGVFAALAGALLAHNSTVVVSSQFDFQLALVFVIMTVVGGLRSRAGVVIGSAFFALLDYFFHEAHIDTAISKLPLLPNLSPELAPIVIGPIMLLFTLTRHPGGWGQMLRPVQRWLKGGRFSFHGTAEAEVRVVDVRA